MIHCLANFLSICGYIHQFLASKRRVQGLGDDFCWAPPWKLRWRSVGNHQFLIGDTSTHSWLGFPLSSHPSFQGVAQVSIGSNGFPKLLTLHQVAAKAVQLLLTHNANPEVSLPPGKTEPRWNFERRREFTKTRESWEFRWVLMLNIVWLQIYWQVPFFNLPIRTMHDISQWLKPPFKHLFDRKELVLKKGTLYEGKHWG